LASASGIDGPDAVSPRGDVKPARLREVEQQRMGIVQHFEDSNRAAGGDQVEIGHATSEQWMSLPEVIVDGEPGHQTGDVLARLLHARQLRHHIDQGLHPIVSALEHGLRHRLL
jgi:hypothetical protein